MPYKTSFHLVKSPVAILEPVTKFGGQPVWIAEPRWPLAPETGEPMLFLGQIVLSHALFSDAASTLVYLFFSDASEPVYNDAIASVIQTRDRVYTSAAPEVEFMSATTGRSLYELDESRQRQPGEYRAILAPEEFEELVPLAERYGWNDLDYETGFQFSRPELAGNKIGGQPLYIEGLSIPPEPFTSAEWLLLLQLAPNQGYWGDRLQPNFYPFSMELGEFGILTVFISRDYQRTQVYIQQP